MFSVKYPPQAGFPHRSAHPEKSMLLPAHVQDGAGPASVGYTPAYVSVRYPELVAPHSRSTYTAVKSAPTAVPKLATVIPRITSVPGSPEYIHSASEAT